MRISTQINFKRYLQAESNQIALTRASTSSSGSFLAIFVQPKIIEGLLKMDKKLIYEIGGIIVFIVIIVAIMFTINIDELPLPHTLISFFGYGLMLFICMLVLVVLQRIRSKNSE